MHKVSGKEISLDSIKSASGPCHMKVIIKPNSRQNELLGFDELKQAYRIAIAAEPRDNAANAELLRFLRKSLKKDCTIITGAGSKVKLVKVL